MELFSHAKSFATRANAIKKLSNTIDLEDNTVRWFIIATEDDRFIPAVSVGNRPELMGLAHHGICVL
jgi:hypothetical protein